ncbi:hypothetical protein ACIGCK_14620 [Microbacterium sp. NPDC078428]|mgnify:CR=1 FL=1|uniref:hypothetical protein n=1 Tax=Microbacterium sp. NPDC078428 TaxID=3364190 RepID=UPI0037CC3EC2
MKPSVAYLAASATRPIELVVPGTVNMPDGDRWRPRMPARSPDIIGRRYLFTGEFVDDWVERSHDIIERFAVWSDLTPLVLLPHDIQREDFEESFETRFAADADRDLTGFLSSGEQANPCLLYVDFAPGAYGDERLILALNTLVDRPWPTHSVLLVHAPTPHHLRVGLFDEHVHFS